MPGSVETSPGEPSVGAQPANTSESARLEALRSYDILDTPPEPAFDRIVELARNLFHTPIALVTLVDESRQWFKARAGLAASETPREYAFCDYAIRQSGVMTVPDATLDARFVGNPLVTGTPHIRFYAGAPIMTPEGFRLGTVCIIAPEPRPDLDQSDRERLEILAGIAANELELRRCSALARTLAKEKELLREELEHRISLTVRRVASVLLAEAERARNPKARLTWFQAADRVTALESLHQHLGAGAYAFNTDASEYLLALIGNLQDATADPAGGQTVSLDLAEDVSLTPDRLMILGMVITQLVADSLRV